MIATIYVVEACEQVRQLQTQQGTMLVQSVKLREVTGNNAYTQRWLVDNISGTDVSDHIGKPIACCIENYVSKTKEGKEFNNLRIREVQKINTDCGAF